MDHDDRALGDELALGDALQLHFAQNGFPSDGGMSEKWALVRVGPIPVGIPNVAARRRATPIHDLNHLVSGYGHDAMGEAENAAWELGSGCRHYAAALLLNCSALCLGILRSPDRLFAAFVRGRRTSNLYGIDIDTVRELPLATVRARLGLDEPRHRATAWDAALFAVTVVAAPVVGAIPVAVSVVTSPVWLARGVHRQRRAAT